MVFFLSRCEKLFNVESLRILSLIFNLNRITNPIYLFLFFTSIKVFLFFIYSNSCSPNALQLDVLFGSFFLYFLLFFLPTNKVQCKIRKYGKNTYSFVCARWTLQQDWKRNKLQNLSIIWKQKRVMKSFHQIKMALEIKG